MFYPEHNIAFNRIAKSGNSSVILYLDEAINGPNNHQDDYKQAKRRAMGTGKSLVEMSRSQKDRASLAEVSFFTVVRNPWTRTLSAFLDKIANGPQDKYGSIPGFGDNSKAGFEAFITFLESGGLQTPTTGNHRTMRYSCPHPSSKAFAGLNISPLNFPTPWPNQA